MRLRGAVTLLSFRLWEGLLPEPAGGAPTPWSAWPVELGTAPGQMPSPPGRGRKRSPEFLESLALGFFLFICLFRICSIWRSFWETRGCSRPLHILFPGRAPMKVFLGAASLGYQQPSGARVVGGREQSVPRFSPLLGGTPKQGLRASGPMRAAPPQGDPGPPRLPASSELHSPGQCGPGDGAPWMVTVRL